MDKDKKPVTGPLDRPFGSPRPAPKPGGGKKKKTWGKKDAPEE